MSHVSTFNKCPIPVQNLAALKLALQLFHPDMELIEGQSDYRTWKDNHNGQLVGDWPVPKGMTSDEVGHNAEHVIRFKSAALKKRFNTTNRSSYGAPYEIGLVRMQVTRDEDGNVVQTVPSETGNEYVLATDFYNEGNGLLNEVGKTRIEKTEPGKGETVAFDHLFKHYQMALTKLVSDAVGDTTVFKEENGITYSETYKPEELHLMQG